jgi:hypothetical protein
MKSETKSKRIRELIEKYESQLNGMICMDDFDGGQRNQLAETIEHLKEIEENEKSRNLKSNLR